MHTPDLIQRIFFERERGVENNFHRVLNDLRSTNFEFIYKFDLEEIEIFWTCFESKKYLDIIKEAEEYIYFYLWNKEYNFEIVIPGHTYKEEVNKNIIDRTPFFHSIWILGDYFPGLKNLGKRPVKISLQHFIGSECERIGKLNFCLKKMLVQYNDLKRPIFEIVDYPGIEKGEKRWRKLIDKRK